MLLSLHLVVVVVVVVEEEEEAEEEKDLVEEEDDDVDEVLVVVSLPVFAVAVIYDVVIAFFNIMFTSLYLFSLVLTTSAIFFSSIV